MTLTAMALATLDEAESSVRNAVTHYESLRRALPHPLLSSNTMQALGDAAAAAVRAELLRRIREIG